MTTIGKGRMWIPHNNYMHAQKSLDTNMSCTSSMNIPPKPSKACVIFQKYDNYVIYFS